MSEKLIAKSPVSLQVEESEKILLDESDQIIAELRQQLNDLQEKVKHYVELHTFMPFICHVTISISQISFYRNVFGQR